MAKQIRLMIIEVENGYVVTENYHDRSMMAGPEYVAMDVSGLADLVSKLAYAAKESKAKE